MFPSTPWRAALLWRIVADGRPPSNPDSVLCSAVFRTGGRDAAHSGQVLLRHRAARCHC